MLRLTLHKRKTRVRRIALSAIGLLELTTKIRQLCFADEHFGRPNMSSYLNLAVRERRGLVYTIESSYVPYSDTGIFTIYFGCDEKHIDKCFLLIDKELRKVMEQPLDARHLLVAKRQTAGGLLIESQNKESLALSMAKSFLHQNRFLPYEAVIEKVSAVTAEQMCNVAQQLFAPENLSRLIYK